jgi:hypothetical protein
LQEQLQFKSLTGPSVACVLWWASIFVPRRNVFELRFDFSSSRFLLTFNMRNSYEANPETHTAVV